MIMDPLCSSNTKVTKVLSLTLLANLQVAVTMELAQCWSGENHVTVM